MSTNSNFKQNKCWSCEFFSGKREYKKGWFGDSVETDDLGTCTNQKNFLHKNQIYVLAGGNISSINCVKTQKVFSYIFILLDIPIINFIHSVILCIIN